MQKTRVVFDTNALRKNLEESLTRQQTKLLIEYAHKKVQEIGNTIASYHGSHGMDRTGNLLDSLCWGVSYKGNIEASGFYRPKQAAMPSTLHEWTQLEIQDNGTWVGVDSGSFPPVNGHELAEEYIYKYGQKSTNGWKVFFAILAPYWGYWEKGFTLKHGFSRKGGFTGATHMRFAVMTQYYDQIKKDLKPARMYFGVSVAKYTSISLYKQAKKGYTKGFK